MEIFHIQGSNWDVISRKKSLTSFFKSKSLLFSSLQKYKNYISTHLFYKQKHIIHFKEKLAMKKISINWIEWSESHFPIKFHLKIYNTESNLAYYSKMSLDYLNSFKENANFSLIKVIKNAFQTSHKMKIPNRSQIFINLLHWEQTTGRKDKPYIGPGLRS